ncbi:PaaI family thioesterase [Nocardia sp. NPDC049707]|uniref:PaaI family thioesterase n=1 Tax=Nocardia sp. NPDC049707 TaxID=3154735 RepID=UPI00341477EC
MNEEQVGVALPNAEHHEGGFRPMSKLINAQLDDLDISRGGPHYGAFIEQVRGLMDRARLACPTDELALETIGILKQLNDKLDAAIVDEWSAPTWTRVDLPSRGNITLPPFIIDQASRDGVDARITFRTFHLGGNNAAHGGHVALGFDDLLGMAAARHTGEVTRTASLTIDYRSITPLDTELQVRAWVERQEGRKVYVRATLHDGDRLCAEAQGLFIVLRTGQR